jgi:transglutaminase-like putative cysteine protease
MLCMDRREFLGALAAAPLAFGSQPAPPLRRTFEITTRVELLDASERTLVWLPMPLSRSRQAPYQDWNGHTTGGNTKQSRVASIDGDAALVLIAEWVAPDAMPWFSVTYQVTNTNHRVPLDVGRPIVSPANLAHYLRPTRLIPTDGIVKETALAITRPHGTPLSRARAIYDWIVEHTVRDPEVKGCGLGDIRAMLEMKNLSGKCADLNALFVGLARAAGLPARDLYGLRVAPSQQFPSLGRGGPDVTTAQHCRAEVWVANIGWIPVDPADVRKLILEERAGAGLDDPYVRTVRNTLFGSWEMNWIAYNDAHDVVLPGSTGKPLPFLMYPQAEVGGVRRDSLDPQQFRYAITAREI